jgi:hypothetical protein
LKFLTRLNFFIPHSNAIGTGNSAFTTHLSRSNIVYWLTQLFAAKELIFHLLFRVTMVVLPALASSVNMTYHQAKKNVQIGVLTSHQQCSKHFGFSSSLTSPAEFQVAFGCRRNRLHY